MALGEICFLSPIASAIPLNGLVSSAAVECLHVLRGSAPGDLFFLGASA